MSIYSSRDVARQMKKAKHCPKCNVYRFVDGVQYTGSIEKDALSVFENTVPCSVRMPWLFKKNRPVCPYHRIITTRKARIAHPERKHMVPTAKDLGLVLRHNSMIQETPFEQQLWRSNRFSGIFESVERELQQEDLEEEKAGEAMYFI